ncbi:Stage II sporulation protein E [Pelotomaculum propionicicum]|uniref:Stage II sporulation protein E n=1 Tax=Pelotomaculum propionicicum TaxID=258475 RepID=A0A4Y7RLF3_9FIRM|nr:Stage II sporulation protein E [Pelotomaculum propionicicum]
MLESPEIYPYHRSGSEKSKHRPGVSTKNGKRQSPLFRAKVRQVVNSESLVLACAGFFLGRAVLLGELSPFGASFVAAAIRIRGRSGVLAVLSVILGLATVSRGIPFTSSLLTMLCTWLLIRSAPAEMKRPWLVLPALVLAATVVVKASFIAYNSPSSYGYFSVLFEAVFAALLTPVMLYGVEALKKKADGVYPFSGEEIFCLLLILGGLIAGTGDLKYEMISVKGVLSKLVILLAAYVGGAGAGAGAGAVVGTIPGLAYVTAPVLVGAYSFAGLLGGICRNFGKPGVATGFILGNIILSVYINDYGNMIAILAETGLATLFFLLVPAVFLEDLKVSLGLESPGAKETPEEGFFYKEIFEARIRNWARVLRELSRTFDQVSSTTGKDWEEQGLQRLINQVGEKICSDCTFYRTCWEREFYKTYQGLIDLIALVELYGKVTPDNLPDEIKRRCSRTKELAITISCLYETYNLNRYWSHRLLESREIVAEQLRGISEVMAGLPGELAYEVEAGEVGPALRRKLKEAGVQVESLSVYRREDGAIEVSLAHLPCSAVMECRDLIMPVLAKLLEQPFYMSTPACTFREGDPSCHLRFYPEQNYRLFLGAAGIGKNGSIVSGDSYAFLHLKGGRLALILSDGMGAGPRAALESGTTISLLRHLLESGFGQDLAIKTVNSILVLRSPGETFATVDLSVINLNSGQADFIKIGAVPTFLIRDGQVEQIKSCSLPVGIIEDLEVSTLTRTCQAGDLLVMVTDGILDAYKGSGSREEWLAGVLLDVVDMQPQEMADLILKLAQAGAGGAARAPDDMTVLVARLEKQKHLKK